MTHPPLRHLACPLCQGPVRRVPRHLIDRVINLFVPSLRYACVAADCDWEALLRRGASRRRTRSEAQAEAYYLHRPQLDAARSAWMPNAPEGKPFA